MNRARSTVDAESGPYAFVVAVMVVNIATDSEELWRTTENRFEEYASVSNTTLRENRHVTLAVK